MIGRGENEDVAHLVPQRRAPVKVAGLAGRRAVHRDHLAKRDAQRAQPRHAHGAHGKIFVIGIDLHLHRARQRHLILLRIGGKNGVQLALDVRQQYRRFALVELDDCRIVAKRVEVLVAVEQAQAVHRGRVAIAVVIREFEFFVRFILLAKAHQVDAQRGMRSPQTRISLDRLAVVSHRVLVAVVQLKLMGDTRIGFAVAGIDGANFREPRVGRVVLQ